MRVIKVLAILFLAAFSVSSNAQMVIEEQLNWTGVSEQKFSEGLIIKSLGFEGAAAINDDLLPEYAVVKRLKGRPARVSVLLIAQTYENLTAEELAVVDANALTSEIKIESSVSYERGLAYAVISFVPIRRNASGTIEKLLSFKLQVNTTGSVPLSSQRSSRTNSSVLSSGQWYKIGVPKDGVYKIDYNFLQNAGIDVNNINPDQINIYGNGSGLLPRQNNVFRYDDLQVNAIEIVGGADGSFDSGDYIMFFAKGPHKWTYNITDEEYRHIKHLYSDTSYYFIGVDVDAPKRINSINSVDVPATVEVNSFDDYMFHELDLVNLIKSGRNFYGELFEIQNSYTFAGDAFTFPNLAPGALAKVRVDMAARTLGLGTSSSYTVSVLGQASQSSNITGVSAVYTAPFAKQGALRLDFVPNNSAFSVKIDFAPAASSSKAWLNFISINVRRQLLMNGSQMLFRDMESVQAGNVAQFNLGNAQSVNHIWNVTDPVNVQRINFINQGTSKTFRLQTNELKEFVAFTGNQLPAPTFFGSVANQDLHALGLQQPIKMVIVAHPRFYSEAIDLANFHINHPVDPIITEVVTDRQVFNEFSSGIPDITAIKDFMKMFYDRANGDSTLMPNYLILFGDGSYDNRSRSESNTNFILTYQSEESFSPISSFVSDDYFGLLDDNEGEGGNELIDIGIGRMSVKTKQEAQDVVKKIKNYMSQDFDAGVAHCSGVGTSVFGEWRNKIMFVGDDEDNNTHMSQSDSMARKLELNHPQYNISKVYLDAYPQQSTPGGQRYPAVNDAIRQNVEKGVLLVNYVGHGGEVGWAHERILDVSTIRNWTNFNALPLFVTATCEFSRYDDPARTSAGEYILINGAGGGVGLLTTTRLVFSNENFTLNNKFYDYALKDHEIADLRVGDILRFTKRALSSSGNNHRNFALLGDPALRLAYPSKDVFTTSITDTLGNQLDTLKALSNVKVSGYVGESNGSVLTNFNGVVTATVFDKRTSEQTLANDGGTPFNYKDQKNVIYRGKAAVENGYFTFSFIVPKDINYSVDSTGRISYYAVSANYDAHGFKNKLVIGSTDLNAAADDTGPVVELYMNDENFVFGGTTNENPIIYARVFDDSGINTVGTGIGHDLTAVLNESTSNAIVLNDYYESDLNTFKSGSVNYPLEELPQGLHKLRVKVWDVHNNSGEAYTEFMVAESENFVLNHLLNYPNPFTTYTEFSFEHNQACAFLNVQIQVFTVSGKLIKTINTVSNTNGFRIDPIPWNGLDDYGDQLARGVYVYKAKVRNPAGEQVEQFEKLVLLK
jgi:hypothetical protein